MVRAQAALIIGACVFVADQATKHLAIEWLRAEKQPEPSALGGWVSLTLTTNHGAAFGAFAGRGLLFVVIALAVIVAIVGALTVIPIRRAPIIAGLGLQLGGATGNVVDRLRLGYVVDFIRIRQLPVFNLADLCIVLGSLVLMYVWIRSADREDMSSTSASAHEPLERARTM